MVITKTLTMISNKIDSYNNILRVVREKKTKKRKENFLHFANYFLLVNSK